jgi:hypothetical protein
MVARKLYQLRLPLLQLLLFYILLTTAKKSSFSLFDPSEDYYSLAIRTINENNIEHGIEVGRAAVRFNINHRDSVVNLGGFYLNLFNREDYKKPVSHLQALELFSIMNYAMNKWPNFHGTVHNMESTLRWLSSSSINTTMPVAEKIQVLQYHKTLNGQETWQQPAHLSKGDRQIVFEYGIKYAPSFQKVIMHRGPLFVKRPYSLFERNYSKEARRVLKLNKMAKKKEMLWKAKRRNREQL